MPQDSIRNTAQVAIGVCLVCSFLVSSAAVGLRARQEENKRLDRVWNILKAAGLLKPGIDIRKVYDERVTPVLIELATGRQVDPSTLEGITLENWDVRTMAADPRYSRALPREEDIAGLVRVPKYMVVYLVKEQGRLQRLVLPIYGKGLWSTLYGFLALEPDLRTVRGITFYEHGETPGLGGEIENPRWQKIWEGKKAFDKQGRLILRVVKGRVDPRRPDASHLIDGLSGATLTTRGVDNLVRYWLGEHGYGPLLHRLREERR